MSKKTPAERAQGVKNGVPGAPLPEAAHPEVGAVAPAAGPQGAGSAAEGEAGVAVPECDYRALYEQANDRWMRTRADFDNYRKRMQREVAESRFQVIMQTVAEFLRLHDQLSMALEHAQGAVDAPAIRQGLELTRAEFDRILAALGVTRIAAVAAPFDPALHEAISQEASAVVPAGTVLREWKAGFVLGGRLLRPATVSVSSGPAVAASAATGAADGAGNRKQ
jgi:molecular chaperone GrpE